MEDIVKKRKEDFYGKYEYLKPECEKSLWEKAKDTCKRVGEWCKENWQSIVKIVVTVVIVVALGIATVMTGGALSLILAGAFWGALSGALIGGIAGGVTSMANGGSFLEGFADGALSGAVSGAITGAVFAGLGVGGSALGTYLGGSCKYAESAGKILKVLQCTSKVTKVLSIGMDGFDTIALVAGIFNPNSLIVQLNEKLHSSKLYNAFQISVNALAIFTGVASSSMNARMQRGKPTCFVAGTMILTAMGLVAIENIRVGDKVIAGNPENAKTLIKRALKTFVNETTELVHIMINGESVISTHAHPFFIVDIGWVAAGELSKGSKLIWCNFLEEYKVYSTEELFQSQLKINVPVYFYSERTRELFLTNFEDVHNYVNSLEPWDEVDAEVFDESLEWIIAVTHEDVSMVGGLRVEIEEYNYEKDMEQ